MNGLKSKAEQLRSLKIGKGLQYLLNEGGRILDNPTLVHDMEYKAVAYTENVVTDDPIWNEFATTGTVSLTRIEFYKNEDFLESAANVQKLTPLRSDKLKYDRIYAKLFNRDKIQIGCACIVECTRRFNADDPDLFELFCDILNKELARSEFFRDYGQAYQESLINRLIEGGVEDKGIYTAHVESIYMRLKSFLHLVVADIGGCDPAYERLAFFRDLFKRAQPDAKYSIYNNYIVIIMSSARRGYNIKAALSKNKLGEIFKEHGIYAGVSHGFEDLFELRKYYNQALAALNGGQRTGGERVFLCNEASGYM